MDIKQIKYRFMTTKQLLKRGKQHSIALETTENPEQQWKILKDELGILSELIRRSTSKRNYAKIYKLIINHHGKES